MIFNIEKQDQEIKIWSDENKNLKLSFDQNGLDLNNEKILNFLTKLSFQSFESLKFEIKGEVTPQVEYVNDLFNEFCKSLVDTV